MLLSTQALRRSLDYGTGQSMRPVSFAIRSACLFTRSCQAMMRLGDHVDDPPGSGPIFGNPAVHRQVSVQPLPFAGRLAGAALLLGWLRDAVR